jgi:ATP/maltotriose-dependent transcriptional regulator MalT
MTQSAIDLASFYCDEGRWEEAELYTREVRHLHLEMRRLTAAAMFAVEARLAAHRGDLVEAEQPAAAAIELADEMDRPNIQAPIWIAFAEVQRAAGRTQDAAAAVQKALELYERKGNVAAADRVREAAAL